MTPAEVDVAVKLFQAFLSAPTVVAIVVLFIFPWVALVWVTNRQDRCMEEKDRRQRERFEAVVDMYERNSSLVEDYRELVQGYKKIVDGQQDLVIHVTQVVTGVHDAVKTNNFCPMVRKEIQR